MPNSINICHLVFERLLTAKAIFIIELQFRELRCSYLSRLVMKMQCFSSIFKIVEFSIWSLRKMCCTAFKSHVFVFPPQLEIQRIWLSSCFSSVYQTFCLHLVGVFTLSFFSVEIPLKWQRHTAVTEFVKGSVSGV